MSLPPGLLVLLSALLLVSGCASFAPDGGLGAVSDITAPALGGPAEAIRTPEQAESARGRVKALLRPVLSADRAVQIALLNNRDLQCAPVGFMDDDPNKRGKVIHGYPVFGGNGMFHRIVTQHNIEQVLISTPRISHERITEILRECESQNIELKRMAITIENIGEPELAVSPLTEKVP